ncbi:MAG: CvpA family protein [Pseudomonadota bacterium]|nr:CvpA family protein [Pseudomonadota bacterium]
MIYTVVDIALVGAIAVSAMFGWLRGFCTETSSLLGWVFALWLTIVFSPKCAVYLESYIHQPQMRIALSAFAIFFVCLMLVNTVSVILKTLMGMLGLGLLDRMLGLSFGVIRGLLVVGGLLILGAGMGWQNESWWRSSKSIPTIRIMSTYCWQILPQTLASPIEKWFNAEYSGTQLATWLNQTDEKEK